METEKMLKQLLQEMKQNAAEMNAKFEQSATKAEQKNA